MHGNRFAGRSDYWKSCFGSTHVHRSYSRRLKRVLVRSCAGRAAAHALGNRIHRTQAYGHCTRIFVSNGRLPAQPQVNFGPIHPCLLHPSPLPPSPSPSFPLHPTTHSQVPSDPFACACQRSPNAISHPPYHSVLLPLNSHPLFALQHSL